MKQETEADYEPNYKSNSCGFCRLTLFTHLWTMLQSLRSVLSSKPADDQNIDVEDTPNITYDESCRKLARQLDEVIKAKTVDQPLNADIMFWVVLKVYWKQIIYISFLNVAEGGLRLGSSVIIQLLISAVLVKDQSTAYMFAGILTAIYLISSIVKHNTFYEAPLLTGRIRSAFVYLLYQRVSHLSQFMVRSTNMGKIINLLASDFNTMEIRLMFVFMMVAFPFILIGASVVLVFRLGWVGLICIAFPILMMPVQGLIGKRNGQILVSLNVEKDVRVKTTGEVIEGIRFIKLYAWEIAFNKIIGKLRSIEIAKYMKIYLGQSFDRALSNSTIYWGMIICFVLMHFTGVGLDSSKIFSTVELMTFIKVNLFLAAMGISYIYELKVLFKRFADIYTVENVVMKKIDETTKKPVPEENEKPKNQNMSESMHTLVVPNQIQVQMVNPENKGASPDKTTSPSFLQYQNLQKGQAYFRNFNGYWSVTDFEIPSLKSLNIHFKKGLFYGIAGKVGSGKSGLLSALLKQVPYYSGEMKISGSVAYVQQQPYIFAGTIRENIIFGKDFDEQLYNRVVQVCCLESDFKIFPNGDKTQVGERGITVSGGQKARLSLARAVYSQADIYLMDDPISAVDAKVARRIYQHVIIGMLKSKTVLLVTHQVHYLTECDRLVIMDDGNIIHQGTPAQLAKELNRLMITEDPQGFKQVTQQHHLPSENLPVESVDPNKKEEAPESDGKLLTNEKQEPINITLGSYFRYMIYNKKYWLIPLMIFLFLCAEACNTSFFRIIGYYDYIKLGAINLSYNDFWLVLGLLQVGFFCFLVLKYYSVNYMTLKSNQKLHQDMLFGMLRSPTSYFDTTPTGRLINRFSNDLSILDTVMAFTMIDTLEGPILAIVLLVNVFQIVPIFIIPGVGNLIILLLWFFYCKRVVIQTKQLDLRSKSPVFSEFVALTAGATQIRIYAQSHRMNDKMSNCINRSIRANHSFWFASRIFGSWTSYISVLICGIGFFVGVRYIENGGLYGISIVFLLQVSDYMQWFLRQIINMESIMVSVERSVAIANLEPEAPLRTEYDKAIGFAEEINQEEEGLANQMPNQLTKANAWPPVANIQFKNFTMKYRKNLDPVLTNINFKINGGEKVGIVGRTGAGKSSIIQALFRMVVAEPGSEIYVGGSDAQQMGLHSLRRNLSIIPQTPFLFRGSIKANIDPFGQYTEQRLWEVLAESDLKDYVETLPKKLETEISNQAQTFSVGQKQLICLARAILRHNKILVLDEATSNVDMRTDDFIQRTLKMRFRDYTVITIAHRLNTIADYDTVIVMDKGKIVEVGAPFNLMTNQDTDQNITKKGTFADMVKSTGDNAANIFRIAKSKYFSGKELKID